MKTQDEKTQEFIEKAQKVHGEKYDYSKAVYINSRSKVTIVCSIHGSFEQIPTVHFRSKGCKKCVYDSKKYTTETFIKKANEIHGENKYDYSKVIYVNYNTKLIIICPVHGEFLQLPYNHIRFKGCKKCVYDRKKYSTETFIKKAKEIHGENKYDYSKSKYIDYDTKLIIRCPVHGDFLKSPQDHIHHKSGCKKCYYDLKRFSTEDFIKKSKEIHGEDKYDYSKSVYINNQTKLIIICLIHGEFLQRPDSHFYQGCGCKKCADNLCKSSVEDFIKKAKTIHKNKYTYDFVKYKGRLEHVIITCSKHGNFNQIVSSHLAGAGCLKCMTYSTEEFVAKATKLHKGVYIYEETQYKNSYSKVVITCVKHGTFFQTSGSHLSGCGCPDCANNRAYSKIAIEWLEKISDEEGIFIQHAENIGEYNIPGFRLNVDGYCASTDTIFEFYGDYWHGNPAVYQPEIENKHTNCTMGELYKRTIEREQIIKKYIPNLITIWECDYRKSLSTNVVED